MFKPSFRNRIRSAQQRLCKLCLDTGKCYIEDEYHFIAICPLYNNLRKKYIKHLDRCNNLKFIRTMNSTNETIIRELACYVYNAFKVRESYLSKMNIDSI